MGVNKENSALHQIEELFQNLVIPENEIIVVHARIKAIKQLFVNQYTYAQITKKIIDFLSKNFNPKTILIPCYTYSYTSSGIFHRYFSKSEVGRFSEEARLLGYYRTPNPIFSFTDTKGYFKDNQIDHNIAFGKGSLFEHLHDQDAVILNVGLNDFIATQRHYAEYYFDVEYRFNKNFNGIIYTDETNFTETNYEYYVRYLDRPTNGNLPKITEDMIKERVLKVCDVGGIQMRWLTCRPYLEFFKPRMKKNMDYMIS